MDNENLALISKALTFWDKISKREQKLILQNITTRSINRGKKDIHKADQECTGILLIKEGILRIYLLSEDGQEITLFRLGKGEVCVLSASCAINNITFDVHMDAETDCQILILNSDIVSNLAQQNIYVENFLYKDAVDKFSQVIWAIQQMFFLRLDQRLAVFLLDEVSKNNTDVISLTHEQIAKNIGSAREVVSRTLKHFAAEGYVELFRGGLRVLDKNLLRLKV